MKAAYQLDGAIQVGEVADPVPRTGQVLVRTNACGLCASDVHLLKGGQAVVDASREFGGPYSDLAEIPSDLDDDLAAMTEPLAVGLEHSRAGDPEPEQVYVPKLR
jgi:threonine dehydrogenase-like Zn-dependent dehydrogenase